MKADIQAAVNSKFVLLSAQENRTRAHKLYISRKVNVEFDKIVVF